MDRLRSPVVRHRALQIAADAVLAALAFYLAFELRFFDTRTGMPERYSTMLWDSIFLVAIGQALLFSLMGLHQKWWRYFNLGDSWAIVRAAAAASVLILAVFTLAQPFGDTNIPRSVLILDFLFTVGLLVAARALAHFIREELPLRRRGRGGAGSVLIVGAGSGGQMVVRELLLNPSLGTPVGFVDDDPNKQGTRPAAGLKVLGPTERMNEILDELEPDEVIIAIPSAPGALRGKVVSACRDREIQVRTLPTVFELLRGGVQLTRQVREVQVEDVLGREPIIEELDTFGGYLRDRIVLVTGAGGSIGSELCRQIARVRPRLLVLVDHAEDNLFQVDRELVSEWHFSRVESVLADCKEADRMLEVMQRFKPEVIFHAAAYKHVPLMEANPLEAVRNNALATRVTAETAAAAGAERFVLISTDKAVDPRTVMGASKAMAEWIVAAAGERYPATRFVAVRFGNVLASSGSVVPIFRRQIERGGPVTVTHPEMTRYFMTIPEAVQLVIRAADLGEATGEIFVLEMGEPVKIVDLAKNMIRLAGYEPETDIPIEFTGPRPGEQLHEQLFATGERSTPTPASRIMRAVREDPISADDVDGLLARIDALLGGGDETNLAAQVIEAATGVAAVTEPGAPAERIQR
ncbi:MAG TPA: nucleoside-diphosphate sugar epimerase/dehydratase [Solirubrobacterales bacterium]|nr:nucleoside-diphosphate sugar epimerase/dehydratase [Solirubrobacterales bacterium]